MDYLRLKGFSMTEVMVALVILILSGTLCFSLLPAIMAAARPFEKLKAIALLDEIAVRAGKGTSTDAVPGSERILIKEAKGLVPQTGGHSFLHLSAWSPEGKLLAERIIYYSETE